jgi:hypothetical protein
VQSQVLVLSAYASSNSIFSVPLASNFMQRLIAEITTLVAKWRLP